MFVRFYLFRLLLTKAEFNAIYSISENTKFYKNLFLDLRCSFKKNPKTPHPQPISKAFSKLSIEENSCKLN